MLDQSVVQLDMDAQLILASNVATFANTKDQAKEILGSAEKIGSNYLLIGDAVNKEAIIQEISISGSSTVWSYESKHYVSDFHVAKESNRNIQVYDGNISETDVSVNQGVSVTWVNNTIAPILIYSGATDYDSFYIDPDLSNYGQDFNSDTINVGDSFTFEFDTISDYSWFVYPSILTGKVSVYEKELTTQDQFIIVENDNLDAPMGSRIIKVDTKGNVVWTFGESYLIKPKDARPLINGNIKISV